VSSFCVLDPSPFRIAAATFTRDPFTDAKSNAKSEHSGDKKTTKQLQHGRHLFSAISNLYLIRTPAEVQYGCCNGPQAGARNSMRAEWSN
jgi:hypothetical protein